MNAHDHNVRVLSGENSWLVQRTDRDMADAGDVLASVGTVLSKWLQHASPAGFRGIFQTLHASPTGARFVIGAARPVNVHAYRERPSCPEGLIVVGKSDGSHLMRAVRAKRPWFLEVVFTWHGGVTYLPWPQHFATVLGAACKSDLDLDWLLLEQREEAKR